MLTPRIWSPLPKPSPRQKAPKERKRRSRINPVSKGRAKQLREYSVKRRAFLLAHPYCQAFWEIVRHTKQAPIMGFYGYGPSSEEIHHKRKPKSTYLNDESTWLAVCRWSHDWIENNKKTARQLGLLD